MVPDDIALQMEAEGGRVSFARFMELALTHPTEGYYSRSERLLGPRGHFSTAPRLSPVFNRAVARLLAELVDSWSTASGTGAPTARLGQGPPSSVIELGGGEGDLVRAVLEVWEETRPDLRAHMIYGIVEIGDGLRARQNEALSTVTARGWKVRWGADLPEAVGGTRPCVILGNEFFDALPIHLVDVRGPRPLEAWVAIRRGAGGARDRELLEVWDVISGEVEAELRFLFGTVDAEALRLFSSDGFIELRPAVRALMVGIAAVMPVGSMLAIDYGGWTLGPEALGTSATPMASRAGASSQAAVSDRAGAQSGGSAPTEAAPSGKGASCYCGCAGGDAYRRTIRGYFRHQLVVDPYTRVGRQDLTADVDFRAMDLHGRATGFETVLFTTVADLLRADGGQDRLSELLESAQSPSPDALEAGQEAEVLENLLDPGRLGGAFKAMLQVRE